MGLDSLTASLGAEECIAGDAGKKGGECAMGRRCAGALSLPDAREGGSSICRSKGTFGKTASPQMTKSGGRERRNDFRLAQCREKNLREKKGGLRFKTTL